MVSPGNGVGSATSLPNIDAPAAHSPAQFRLIPFADAPVQGHPSESRPDEQMAHRSATPARFSQPAEDRRSARDRRLAAYGLALSMKIQDIYAKHPVDKRSPGTLLFGRSFAKRSLSKHLRHAIPETSQSHKEYFNRVTGSIDTSAEIVIVVSPKGEVLGVFTHEQGQWIKRNAGDSPDAQGKQCNPSDFLQDHRFYSLHGHRVKVIEFDISAQVDTKDGQPEQEGVDPHSGHIEEEIFNRENN